MCQWDFPVDEPVSLPVYRRHRLVAEMPAIVERLRGGMSLRALADEYGVSREAIRRAVARAGVLVQVAPHPEPAVARRRARAYRLPGRGRSRVLAPNEVATLLARHDGGESIRALARATGVSHETVRRLLSEVDQASKDRATA